MEHPSELRDGFPWGHHSPFADQHWVTSGPQRHHLSDDHVAHVGIHYLDWLCVVEATPW